MRKYINIEENHLEMVKCNKCGRLIKVENGIVREGIFSVDYSWGYFSEKDSEIHSFDICEKCYNEMIEGFAIPVKKVNNNELL